MKLTKNVDKKNRYLSVKSRIEITKNHLKKYGAMCPLCGLKADIQKHENGGLIWLKGKEWRGKGLGYIDFHVDHIIPISKNGKNKVDNCWLLCASCNLKKYTKIIKIN